MLVNVLMIGGVVIGGAAIPALLAALYLTPTPFSPDYIMAMRMLAGFAAATFVFRRR